jgi:hypothetical protein
VFSNYKLFSICVDLETQMHACYAFGCGEKLSFISIFWIQSLSTLICLPSLPVQTNIHILKFWLTFNIRIVLTGACIRDDQGQFVLAKTEWYIYLWCWHWRVIKDWAYVFILIQNTNKTNIPLSFDMPLFTLWRDESVFGDIIKDCKNVFYSYFTNFHVEFIRRQANEVAHCLAKAAHA